MMASGRTGAIRRPQRDRRTSPEHGRAASVSLVLKRLIVGQPVRTDSVCHSVLSKRIALPVFASDALSSVAYAPDGILLTLSIGLALGGGFLASRLIYAT